MKSPNSFTPGCGAFHCWERIREEIQIHIGCCAVTAIFDNSLSVLIRGKHTTEKLGLIDVGPPGLDKLYAETLARFQRGEINKMVFKPNERA